ncbi:Disease resistance protein [Quillaja saponaria]|uniref:Disease resistance protein n=1 Tax=Quillaja saponaria TaxID=32244 RepID=A0AAD7PFN5_QUISA|nr:Disease resistance protein [Quillaja saponaria]
MLDEFQCVAMQKKWVRTHGSLKRKVSGFFSSSNSLAFRLKMGHKITKLRKRLDEVAADKAKFNLVENTVDRHVVHRREMTHSFVVASEVIGREYDKENIIDLLMTTDGDDHHHHRNVTVVPIVGIGGLGKTTLSKLVFNDQMAVDHFQLRMWVCVSEDFDLKQLIIKIIKSASNVNLGDFDIEQLQNFLRTILSRKIFLFVLDDVWNEDRGKWMELRDLLRGGAGGSKIFVTTRSNSIASMMGTVPSYRLYGLVQEDCLSLFVNWHLKKDKRNNIQIL